MRIGVIDSGIGGLTVLETLINNYPHHEYIYFGDTINVPYGEKTQKEVIEYTNKIIKFLEKNDIELIIMACGTMCSNIKNLTSNVRLIDIISLLNNKLDNYKNISIMATPLSIKINDFKKYIKSDINLISCSKLVPIIESNDYSNLNEVLKDYLKSTDKSDALILGCTHYKIVIDYIKKYFKKDIITLDTNVLEIIKDLKKSHYSLKLYFSKIDNVLINNVKNILKRDDLDIEWMCLND